ncbi:MAG TPA: hypothetical protein PLF37_00565 [Planctomycetota bacterium]|nr:hypothetical protein [Planctomycetota bacterium]
MAKKPEPDRKIKLPGASGQSSMSGARPQPRPAQAPQGAAPTDDVGRAIENLERSAQVRSKHDLPDRVKVITPDVIKGIVHSIVDKFVTDGVTADELATLTAENTQMQLRMQQMQGREQGMREELERLRAYVDELQGMLDAHVQGRATADQNVQYYETQIRDLQQKNAQMVDLYADAQRQLEEQAQAAQENEAALDHTAGELVAARDALAAAEAELDQLRSGVQKDSVEAEQFAEKLGADLEAAKAESAELQQRIEDLEASLAERAENINQERTARERLERELDAANGRLTAMEAESDKLRQDTSAADKAQARVAELEGELAALRDKLVQNNENASGNLRELQERNRKLNDQVRDFAVKERKYEQIDAELEKLRVAEGKWLEERRNMAAQLSHETNLRREVEAKLKAIEKGEILPGGKALEERLAEERKKSEAELARLNEHVKKAEKEAALARQAAEKQAEMHQEVTRRDERITQLEKQLAEARAQAAVGGEQAKGEMSKADEKIKKLNDQVRELSVIARKYDNVAADLEALRVAEGKWLEEKRVLAGQVTHEADLRKKLEAKLQGLNLGDLVERARLDEAEKTVKGLREEVEALKKKLLTEEQAAISARKSAGESVVNERSLQLVETENERLRLEADDWRNRSEQLEAELAGKTADSKRVTLVQAELARTRADLEIARGEREAAYADLNIAKEQLARERREQAARFAAITAQVSTLDQIKRERDEAQSARDVAQRELEAERSKADQRASVTRDGLEQWHAREKELEGRVSARDLQLTVAQQQIADLRAEVALLEEAGKDLSRAREDAARELERRGQEQQKAQEALERAKERARDAEHLRQESAAIQESLRQDLALAREEAARHAAQLEAARKELERLARELAQARAEGVDNAAIEKEVASRSLSVVEAENERLRARVDEITGKRDDLRAGLEQAMAEIKGLEEALAKAGHDERQARRELEEAREALEKLDQRAQSAERRMRELEQSQSELAPAAATAAQVAAELEESRTELRRVSTELESIQHQFVELQSEADEAETLLEQERKVRHEHEVQLAETRARLEAEIQVRLERDRRITQLDAELAEEREKRMNSAPAAAVESLAQAVENERKLADDRLAAERDKWETRHKADLEELQRQRELTKEAEMETAALQDRLDELEGKTQQAAQESLEARRLSGQRRAQIERMQAEVERAREAAKTSEHFWKQEMKQFEEMIRVQLEMAERKEEGADVKMVRVLEDLQVGVFDKYSKARKKLNRLEKAHEAAHVKIKTLEKVIDAHEKQGQLLQKLKQQESGIQTKPRRSRKKSS